MVHLPVNHFDCYLVHAPTSSLETPPDSAAQDSPIYNIPLGLLVSKPRIMMLTPTTNMNL